MSAGEGSNASSSCINIGDENGGGAVIIFNRIVTAIVVAITGCKSCSILIRKRKEEIIFKGFSKLAINDLSVIDFFNWESLDTVVDTGDIIQVQNRDNRMNITFCYRCLVVQQLQIVSTYKF